MCKPGLSPHRPAQYRDRPRRNPKLRFRRSQPERSGFPYILRNFLQNAGPFQDCPAPNNGKASGIPILPAVPALHVYRRIEVRCIPDRCWAVRLVLGLAFPKASGFPSQPLHQRGLYSLWSRIFGVSDFEWSFFILLFRFFYEITIVNYSIVNWSFVKPAEPRQFKIISVFIEKQKRDFCDNT